MSRKVVCTTKKKKRIFKSSEIWNAVLHDEKFAAFRRRLLGTSLFSVQSLIINMQKTPGVAPYKDQEETV
jgi:hypothetical protein